MLKNTNIVLGVSGGIAAYKAAELCSLLRKEGACVRIAMSASAGCFIAPLTFEALTQHPVYSHVLGGERSYEMEHISWAKWANLLLVAPASADIIAKMAAGLADDPVTALYVSYSGQVVIAPAMNTQMLAHPATQKNLDTLRLRGVAIIEPETGVLACGDVGPGKLAALTVIVDYLKSLKIDMTSLADIEGSSEPKPIHSSTTCDPEPDTTLAGKTVLITSGPTHEYLDPVRFLTNPSSGKMGTALAREAARRGATVHFVTGPVNPSLLPSDCATIHKVTTAEQMLRAVLGLKDVADIFIFAAAVSDFRVANAPSQKIKRTGNSLTLPLVENPDIAMAVGHVKRKDQISVGFAAETQEVEQNALTKIERKRLDMIVANDVANRRVGFESDENEVMIYFRDGRKIRVSQRPKTEIAREILAAVLTQYAGMRP